MPFNEASVSPFNFVYFFSNKRPHRPSMLSECWVDVHALSVKRPSLRSIERRPQVQFSIARKFPLWPLRRYDVNHSNLRKFTFMRHGRRKPKNTAWARTNILWVWSPPLCHCAILTWEYRAFLKYIFFFFVNFLCLRNIPRQCIQNARICFISYAA